MSVISSLRDAQMRGAAARHGGARDTLTALLLLLVLIRAGAVMAGEQASFAVVPPKPEFKARPDSAHELPSPATALFDLPKTYQATEPATGDMQALGDFRPRGRSVQERDSQIAVLQDEPMQRSTSMWQRLSDYRSHGRVRLLTLWEMAGSSVSLQAGRKGEPSLQWTSHSMNHGGAPRGVFDQLLPSVMTGGSRTPRAAVRAPGSDAMTRPTKTSEPAMGPPK